MYIYIYRISVSVSCEVTPGVNHYNLVADPGAHSYSECLVSLVWSWERQCGAYPVWQLLKPGKAVLTGEAVLDTGMETLRQERKLDRVSAYRQLQGISNQIYHLSGGLHKIDTFQLPSDSNVRPVAQGEERCTVSDATTNCKHVFIRNTDTQEVLRVLPVGLVDVKLLLLQYDQGSIGAAGVSFLELSLGWMITVKFDKIHRIIRDLKMAAKECPVFMKTKLWSAYLYALNKRPFGSGAHGTAKTRMLEVFMATTTIHSPKFIKYLPRLAKERLGM